MATYVLPQAIIHQEFTATPLAVANPLRACIVGPNAKLFRYSDSDEKSLTALGDYDPSSDTEYEYPNKPTGSKVDKSYFKLYGDDVLLRYFQDLISVGGTVLPVAGYRNRVRSSTVNFVENGPDYPRDAALHDRDVQVGDVVDIRGVVSGTEYTLRSTVKAIVGDIVSSVVEPAESDSGNAASQSYSLSIAQTAGPYNCVYVTGDGSLYDGSADGDISETYTVEVTKSSVGGDLSTAKLRVKSASGRDDDNDVQPGGIDVPVNIGSRGLKIQFKVLGPGSNFLCSEEAEEENVSHEDLIKGQKWVIEVSQSFTAPVATSGGTYTGDIDTTYVVTVTRGGKVTGTKKPQITVTTVHGVDVSGPTNISATGTAYNIGTKGVTISFSSSPLRKGDIYYVDVRAAKEGAMRTIVLNNNMPDALLSATDLDLTLYIKKSSVLIPQKREGAPPLLNYELDDETFTVSSGITLYDDSWTSGGVKLPLDMAEGSLFAEYRAWVSDLCSELNGLTDDDGFDDIPGALHPDNPLKYGVFKAWSNSGGTEVKYISVCDPDSLESWQDAVEVLVGVRGIHGIVPLTTNKQVLDLFAAHVKAQSAAEVGRWRVLWQQLSTSRSVAVVDQTKTSDNQLLLVTISEDPETSGTQYTVVRCPAGNGDFVDRGVRANDVLRVNYSTDGWGDIVYEEYVIEKVVNNDELKLKSGPSAPITVAKKAEIWRTRSKTEYAEAIAQDAATLGHQRIRAIWPDEVGAGNLKVAGYFLAAALAGLRSGSLPQRGLTNVEIAGFDDVSRTTELFNRAQLDKMAESGVWIVTRAEDGSIISRHALTTAGYGDLLLQEEMVNANVDSISDRRLRGLEDLIGRVNVTPGVLNIISNRMKALNFELGITTVDLLGPQLIASFVTEIRQHSILRDRVVVRTADLVPAPLNVIELFQQIVV